jgi:hypothetical protein
VKSVRFFTPCCCFLPDFCTDSLTSQFHEHSPGSHPPASIRAATTSEFPNLNLSQSPDHSAQTKHSSRKSSSDLALVLKLDGPGESPAKVKNLRDRQTNGAKASFLSPKSCSKRCENLSFRSQLWQWSGLGDSSHFRILVAVSKGYSGKYQACECELQWVEFVLYSRDADSHQVRPRRA